MTVKMRLASVAVATLLAATGSLLVATSASADTGDRHLITNCGDDAWQSPATGTAHAQIRFCAIDWFKNILDNYYSQTITFQFRDSSTDGHCANASINNGGGSYSECNAVWKAVSKKIVGRHSSITVTLSYGGISPVSKTKVAPSGF